MPGQFDLSVDVHYIITFSLNNHKPFCLTVNQLYAEYNIFRRNNKRVCWFLWRLRLSFVLDLLHLVIETISKRDTFQYKRVPTYFPISGLMYALFCTIFNSIIIPYLPLPPPPPPQKKEEESLSPYWVTGKTVDLSTPSHDQSPCPTRKVKLCTRWLQHTTLLLHVMSLRYTIFQPLINWKFRYNLNCFVAFNILQS